MHKLTIQLQVWLDKSGENVKRLFREVEVPFVPFVGLSISSNGWESGPLESIRWDIDKELFIGRVADERPGEYGDSYINGSELLEIMLDNGWQKSERKPA